MFIVELRVIFFFFYYITHEIDDKNQKYFCYTSNL